MLFKNLIAILATVTVTVSKINQIVASDLPKIYSVLNSSLPFVNIKNNETVIYTVQDQKSAKIFSCQASYPVFWRLYSLKNPQPIIHHHVLQISETQRMYRVDLELDGLTYLNRGYFACHSKNDREVKSEFYLYIEAVQPTLISDRKTEVVFITAEAKTVTLPCLSDVPLGGRSDVRLLLFHQGRVVESAKYDDLQGFQVDLTELKRLRSNFKFECRLFRRGQRESAGNPNFKVFFVVVKQVSISPSTTAVFIDPNSSMTFKCQDTSAQASSVDVALLRNNSGSTNINFLKPSKGALTPSTAQVALERIGKDVNLICVRKSTDGDDGPAEVLHQWRVIPKRSTKPPKELSLLVSPDLGTLRCYFKGPNAKPPILQLFACSTPAECSELTRTFSEDTSTISFSNGCSKNYETLTWTDIKSERGSICFDCSTYPTGSCDCIQHKATKPGLYRCEQQASRDDGDLLYLPQNEQQCSKKLVFVQPQFEPLFRGINSCSRLQNNKSQSFKDGLYWDGRCGIPFQAGVTHVLKCVGRRGNFAKNIEITTSNGIPADWQNVTRWTSDDAEHGFTSAMLSFTLPSAANFSDVLVDFKCEAPLATEAGVRSIETTVEVGRAFQSPGFSQSAECSSSVDYVPDCPADRSSIIVKSCNADSNCKISCSSANAFPRPQHEWFRASKIEHACSKNLSKLQEDSILEIVEDRVEFIKFHPSQVGIYICVGRIQVPPVNQSKNYESSSSDAEDEILCQGTYFDVKMKPEEGADWRWKLAIGIIIPLFVVALIFAVVYHLKFKNEQHRANMLSKRDIHEFVHGNQEALNAEVDLSEQAHLLPYKNEYEFPFEKLKFGKMLGSGAYGIVYRAEAANIQHEGVETTVAVKTVVPDADLTYFKALLKELKVMIHIGSHLNVVNLLGACTNDLKNKKIFVIVEFCCYGNMQHYLQKYRRQFVDQIRDGKVVDVSLEEQAVAYANIEFNQVNSGSSEAPLISVDTASSTVSYSNIEPTGCSSDSQTGEGDQPLWRTNIKGDFNAEEKIVLNTTTCINWSYQVAKGMEYLAMKKVFHGDLAARNVLLAEGGVVKVADFGLARQVYQDANYIKQERCPLPLKWMALESLLRMEFSSKSDVWAFGVLLWEIFTLGQVPYAGEQIDATFVAKLEEGHRLRAPQYATEDIYKMMVHCWDVEPLNRPDFTALADFFLKILQSIDFKSYERLSALESKIGGRKFSHTYENVPK